MDESSVTMAVIMECVRLANKWADYRWEAIGVVPQPPGAAGGQPRKLVEERDRTQWLFPGFELRLRADEAEDYLLNVTAPEPRVFVVWRMDGELARPAWVTASYGSAARTVDAGEQVDGVAMPQVLREWVEAYARVHYRPPERTKGRFAATRRGSPQR
ncbi:MAG: DUF3305 domain-containing protein [Rhodocyclaceae bacterium]